MPIKVSTSAVVIHWQKIKIWELPSIHRDYTVMLKGFRIISVAPYGFFGNKVLLVYETRND